MIIRRNTYPFTEQDISIVEMNAKDAHIAELEAEREITAYDLRDLDACLLENEQLKARIADLEAEVDRLKNVDNSRNVEAREITSEFVRLQTARIAELEAKREEAWNTGYTEGYNEAYEKYGKVAVLAEREACAKIAEDWHTARNLPRLGWNIAVAIRARLAP